MKKGVKREVFKKSESRVRGVRTRGFAVKNYKLIDELNDRMSALMETLVENPERFHDERTKLRKHIFNEACKLDAPQLIFLLDQDLVEEMDSVVTEQDEKTKERIKKAKAYWGKLNDQLNNGEISEVSAIQTAKEVLLLFSEVNHE